MIRKILALYILIMSVAVIHAQSVDVLAVPFCDSTLPKREVRAVWLTTLSGLDWPKTRTGGSQKAVEMQQRELTDILDKLQQGGVNTVLIQARTRASVIYPSQYEPWEGCLSGKAGVAPGYDPLKFAIDECHKRGMEAHAWVVTIPVGKWNSPGCKALRKKYPSLVKKIGDEGFMNPESQKTGDILADICGEITDGYDVDGIHLDYIRYPEKWKGKVTKERGREYITDIVKKINLRVKSRKPWVKLSCSPIGKYSDLPRQSSRGWNAYTRVMQDAQKWLKEGLMDMLFPMMYFRDENFYPFALDWMENSYERLIVPGLGIYFMSPSEGDWSLEDITREMHVARQHGMGHAYFRSRFFTDNVKGLYNFASEEFDNIPALVPPMTWESDKMPTAPDHIEADSLSNTLSWSGAEDKSGAGSLTYNIYSSRKYPVDTDNPANLMSVRNSNTSIKVPLDGRYYAVTAMDRYGNESEPLQNTMKVPEEEPMVVMPDGIPLECCNGEELLVDISCLNNSDLLQIATPQGVVVKTSLISAVIDLSKVADGFYQVRSLGKKSSHRLCWLKLDRTGRSNGDKSEIYRYFSVNSKKNK